jgi:hypothetical protein
MADVASRRNEVVQQAAALAKDLAADIASIVLIHYPDAATLDMVGPAETDIETATAVNRAVATVLAAAGVRIFVQEADRASFRCWMDGRANTRENRLAWRDRGKLLSGTAAIEKLGLDPLVTRPRPGLGTAPGPLADRLLRAFAEDDGSEFEDFAHELLATGRDGVLDLAVRKASDRMGEEAADELTASSWRSPRAPRSAPPAGRNWWRFP